MTTLLHQVVHQQLRHLTPGLAPVPAPSLRLHDDLALAAFDVLAFALALEDVLNLDIPREEIEQWHTLDDVYQSLARLPVLPYGLCPFAADTYALFSTFVRLLL